MDRDPLETKFVLPAAAVTATVAWLDAVCARDPAHPAGLVSSIYYDTPGWRFLQEKLASDYLKTKVRLRWYADLEGRVPEGRSWLEVKRKVGPRRRKLRLPIARAGRWLGRVRLADRRLLEIPRRLAEHGVALPGPLVPAFLIRYRRRRWLEPRSGVRVNLDYDIAAPAVNPRMLPRTNPRPLETAVLEIKGAGPRLPPGLHGLLARGLRRESFSKYGSCYRNIMRTAF